MSAEPGDGWHEGREPGADARASTHIAEPKRSTRVRSRGEGTIYRDGAYFVAEVEWTDATGTHRKRRKRKTKTEAIEARRQLIEEIKSGRSTTGTAFTATVADAVRAYLLEAESRVAARTYTDYKRIAEGQIVPAIGRMRAHAVRRRDIVRMLDAVKGARSKQYCYVVAKAAVGPYVRAVDPLEHPFPPRSAPRVPKRLVKPFDGDLCARILAAVHGHPVETLVILALATGTRESELLGLRWGDVGDGFVIVTSKLDETTRTTGPTKTDGGRRRIDVPGEIGELLAAHRAAAAARKRPAKDRDFVFLNRSSKPIRASNLRRTWRKLRAKHGLPADFRIYDLRHMHASVLAAAGVASKVIAERLGHGSTRITDDTYSHLMPGMQAGATAAIGRALRDAAADKSWSLDKSTT
jgi:integrase